MFIKMLIFVFNSVMARSKVAAMLKIRKAAEAASRNLSEK